MPAFLAVQRFGETVLEEGFQGCQPHLFVLSGQGEDRQGGTTLESPGPQDPFRPMLPHASRSAISAASAISVGVDGGSPPAGAPALADCGSALRLTLPLGVRGSAARTAIGPGIM